MLCSIFGAFSLKKIWQYHEKAAPSQRQINIAGAISNRFTPIKCAVTARSARFLPRMLNLTALGGGFVYTRIDRKVAKL